jgi:hypothetical protein
MFYLEFSVVIIVLALHGLLTLELCYLSLWHLMFFYPQVSTLDADGLWVAPG